ncbi:MAG: hypothetical protein DRH90_18120 [Deltaproteobacteria bacterium]|nr:MAG: hypothetical protein DRH90_18120 [Deltaproteobacteria bacterium]RLC10021.1 MAG: hypothetical protein DRI24_20890 [Deltaproteobacteria bacterium]
MSLHQSIKDAQYDAFDRLSVGVTWTQAKAPNATKDIRVGFKSLGWRDQELINAYGIGAKIFTVKVDDIPVIDKFDKITLNGEAYTVNSVMPAYVGDMHTYHKVIVNGK